MAKKTIIFWGTLLSASFLFFLIGLWMSTSASHAQLNCKGISLGKCEGAANCIPTCPPGYTLDNNTVTITDPGTNVRVGICMGN